MTVAEITEFRDAAKVAYLNAMNSKSYGVNSGGASRNITKQDIDKLKKEYLDWDKKLSVATGKSRRIKYAVPLN
jgi:hypothetical protein